MPPVKVCIVSHQAFGAMDGGRDGHAGGVERQTTMLARWLAIRGFAVSLVVWNEGQPEVTAIDGVRVISVCARNDGWPLTRFVHPRWTSLVHALRRANADIYYHNCAEYVTGQVALWCRRNRRTFIYSVASDPECDRRLPALKHLRERVLFRYGLRHADRIIVQTEQQRQRLKDDWALDSLVLKMPVLGRTAPLAVDTAAPAEPRVVWVGRISAEKRLDRLLDIAARLPHVRFNIAGAPDDTYPEGAALMKHARTRPNVKLLGKVPRDQMPAVYAGATCLLCTSEYEGFPNTFLEAWSHGVPVVATVDPDGLIGNEQLGFASYDIGTLVRCVALLDTTPELREQIGHRARQYVRTHHAPEAALTAFEHAFLEVLTMRGARP